MEKRKVKNREEYFRNLEKLTGLPLVKAVTGSIYKKFSGSLPRLGIDSYGELLNVIYIISRDTNPEPGFLPLYRNVLDFLRKEFRKTLSGKNRVSYSELSEILSDNSTISDFTLSDIVELLKVKNLSVSIFKGILLEGKEPKGFFKKLGITPYNGYRELRRIEGAVYSILLYKNPYSPV